MAQYKVNHIEQLSDLSTPVGVFLKLREAYPEVLLLESSDYSSKENSLSFLCCDSFANLQILEDKVQLTQGKETKTSELEGNVVNEVQDFMSSFSIEGSAVDKYLGAFGFSSFDAIPHFENIKFRKKPGYNTPDIRYDFFRFVIVFDHFFGKMTLIELQMEGEVSQLDKLEALVNRQDQQAFGFETVGNEEANMSDEDFKRIVTTAKAHCQRGNIFQMVPARRFSQAFSGDEFNVYRALRSINPSPYLFYFDYSSYKIFGSSPEAQLIVKDSVAEIHPIAGTFKRSGDMEEDQATAKALAADPKENAEHTMLVDLARNDLSKNCKQVFVEKFKEVQYFSHVIHLTSVVKGTVNKGVYPYQIFADTFPAGTLSGAPKYKALSIIDEMEPTKRGFYGGGIGLIGINGDVNHAIIIRSFFSWQGKLYYQAGAGIVIDSDEEKELNEVSNKLAALKKALSSAANI